eukprot:scaffold198_cov169-Ochromonas_danica.AAC.18
MILLLVWVLIELQGLIYGQVEDPSLISNLFGQCSYEVVKHYPALAFPSQKKENIFSVHLTTLEDQTEAWREFLHLPSTLSQVNEKLALGIVKGQSVAKLWVSRQDNSWQYPLHHPRRNKTQCLVWNNASLLNPISVYDDMRNLTVGFYLVMQQHVLIHEAGVVAQHCGYFQCLEGCETVFKFIGRKWYNKCKADLNRNGISWKVATSPTSPLLPSQATTGSNHTMNLCRGVGWEEWKYAEQVLIVSSLWDNNYHHFLIDGLARLIHYLPLLEANPLMKIHLRASERSIKRVLVRERAVEMKLRILDLLGIDPKRVVTGPVIAQQVFIPRCLVCGLPIRNALEVRKLAHYMLQRAANKVLDLRTLHAERWRPFFPFTVWPPVKESSMVSSADRSSVSTSSLTLSPILTHPKVIVVQVRHCQVGMKCGNDWRTWELSISLSLTNALHDAFPTSQILIANDSVIATANCLACEVEFYRQTDLLIGLHGAGMTNMIFMKPESVVVEITGQYDGRMMVGCGYHGNLAAIFGVHHYLYYYDWRGGEILDGKDIARRAEAFYSVTRRPIV